MQCGMEELKMKNGRQKVYTSPETAIMTIEEIDILTTSLNVRLESVGDELSWEIFDSM